MMNGTRKPGRSASDPLIAPISGFLAPLRRVWNVDPSEWVRRRLRNALKRGLARTNFAFESSGFRLQPIHYYSETPSRRDLANNRELWAKPLSLHGVSWDLDEQFAWLSAMTEPFIAEVEGLEFYRALESRDFGPGYGPIESLLLHCVIRQLAPKRIIEIGSGLSTMMTLHATELNALEGRTHSEIICVEPNPHEALKQVPGIRLIESAAQRVPVEVFDQLGPGDVLFLDSTHSVKTGSELARLYLEVLPRLHPGVLVHIHDVYLPYNFAPDILFNLFDWQETTLIAALLIGNRSLEVLASMSALHHERCSELKAVFSDYQPCKLPDGLSTAGSRGHFPSSLWLSVVPDALSFGTATTAAD